MKKLLALICAAAITTGAYAQDDEDDEFDFSTESSVSFSVGTDIASGYVWRGLSIVDQGASSSLEANSSVQYIMLFVI